MNGRKLGSSFYEDRKSCPHPLVDKGGIEQHGSFVCKQPSALLCRRCNRTSLLTLSVRIDRPCQRAKHPLVINRMSDKRLRLATFRIVMSFIIELGRAPKPGTKQIFGEVGGVVNAWCHLINNIYFGNQFDIKSFFY